MRLGSCLALCCLALAARSAGAANVEIPLRVPLETLRLALAEQLAASPAHPGEIFRDGPCRVLALDAPKLEALDGVLRFTGPGKAVLGVELFGKCRNAVDWSGTVELDLVPRIDAAGKLRVRIVDSRLADAAPANVSIAARLWDLAKPQVHERLERFGYDLGASRAALDSMLRGAAPAAEAEAMAKLLKQVEVLAPRVEPRHVAVPLAMVIPDAWASAPQPAASTAPLSDEEMDALEKAVEPWDAFLVAAVRQAALDSDDAALRERLFTLLLESRYELVAILSGESPGREDPVRRLFVDAWNELRAVLGEAEEKRLLGASVLRYALFVDAGDALMALEQAAPGLRFSAEGLRQLARTLRPGAAGDPLAYGWDVDGELQRLFAVPGIAEPAPAPVPGAKTSSLDAFVRAALAPQPAHPLERWVPGEDELGDYESELGELLDKTAAQALSGTALHAPYDAIFSRLVPTTALVESCWHQYVQRGGKVTYLRSGVGSVGLMQINQRVWRGFYDVQRLRWDTAYNALAGAQILLRYVKDYAIPYAESKRDPERVARAAYAVYNAGPRAVGRFDRAKPPAREARVDAKLWRLYRGIAAGGKPDLKSCAVRASGESL